MSALMERPIFARCTVIPLSRFVIWEAASLLSRSKFDYHSSQSAILCASWLVFADGSVLLSTWQTFEAAAAGLLLAIALGVMAGAVIGLSPLAEVAALPTIEGHRVIPSVAYIPMALLLFGYGLLMEGSAVFYACVWPVLVATIDAVRGVEPRLIEVGRSMQFSFAESIWKIVLPAALPRIMVGTKIAVGFALVVAVTVEIVVNPRGLGYALVVAQQQLDVDLMNAQLQWLGLRGVAMNAVIERPGGARSRKRHSEAGMNSLISRPPWWLGVVFLVALQGLLLAASAAQFLSPVYFPTPSSAFRVLGERLRDGSIWPSLGNSMMRMFYGWALACLLGIAPGGLVGSAAVMRDYLRPILEFFRPLPASVIIPMAVLFLGLSNQMSILVIAFVSIWPVLLGSVQGFSTVKARLIEFSTCCR